MKFKFSPAIAKNIWKKLLVTKTSNSSPMQLRCSNLPICPRAYYLDHKYGPLMEENSYSKTAMTEKGVFVHEALQKFLGLSGILYGMWVCPAMKMGCSFRTGPGFLPEQKHINCPTHGFPLKYEELVLDYKGLTGHCDGVIDFKGKLPKTLLEIKTLSTLKADGTGWINLKEPYEKHVYQSTMYAYIFNKKGALIPGGERLKLPIKNVVMWYVHSDYPWRNPKTWSFVPEEKMALDLLKSVKLAKLAVKNDILPKRDCDVQPPYCEWGPICFNRIALEKNYSL